MPLNNRENVAIIIQMMSLLCGEWIYVRWSYIFWISWILKILFLCT